MTINSFDEPILFLLLLLSFSEKTLGCGSPATGPIIVIYFFISLFLKI